MLPSTREALTLLATAALALLQSSCGFVPPQRRLCTPTSSSQHHRATTLHAEGRRNTASTEEARPPRRTEGSHSRVAAISSFINCIAVSLLPLGASGVARAAPPPPIEPQSYLEQIEKAMPIKTIRGVWRVREYRDDHPNTVCVSRVRFKGFIDEPNKGTAVYKGCGDEGKGRGNWLLKPNRIRNGQIGFNARWKIRFNDGQSLIYRGDVLPGGNYAKADATITSGEILQPVKGFTGNLTEKKVRTFEADLVEKIDDENERM